MSWSGAAQLRAEHNRGFLRARRQIPRRPASARCHHQRASALVQVGHCLGPQAVAAPQEGGDRGVRPNAVLPRRRRPGGRRGRFGGLVLGTNPAPAVAERTGDPQATQAPASLPFAFGAGDRVGHRRPVPAHEVHATQTLCLVLLPLRSIHSPPAPMQVPQIGAFSSSAIPRRYAAPAVSSGPRLNEARDGALAGHQVELVTPYSECAGPWWTASSSFILSRISCLG